MRRRCGQLLSPMRLSPALDVGPLCLSDSTAVHRCARGASQMWDEPAHVDCSAAQAALVNDEGAWHGLQRACCMRVRAVSGACSAQRTKRHGVRCPWERLRCAVDRWCVDRKVCSSVVYQSNPMSRSSCLPPTTHATHSVLNRLPRLALSLVTARRFEAAENTNRTFACDVNASAKSVFK